MGVGSPTVQCRWDFPSPYFAVLSPSITVSRGSSGEGLSSVSFVPHFTTRMLSNHHTSDLGGGAMA